VAELEISGTHEEQFAIMRATLIQVHTDLNGNGQPGIKEFVSGLKGQFRLLILLMTAIGVLVAIVGALEANRQFHSGLLKGDNEQQNAELSHIP
jgi:hypothetical protein